MKKDFYNEEIEDVYKRLETNINGLSEEEASNRLLKDGENKLTERKKKSNLALFLGQFNDIMIIILLIAAVFSMIISYVRKESYLDSIVIILIVLLNAILSFIQEKKADVAIQELNKMFITNNHVIRGGIKKNIDVRNIVVGDIIELEAGDYISADSRIISSDGFETNESTLTGESLSVKKSSDVLAGYKELYERSNMVFAGCNVTMGRALVVVTSTGMNTELGKIATSLIDKKSDITPLQKKINQISKVLTYIVIGVIFLMMIIGLLMKNDFFDVLMLSISLAVAAIPEGLSSIITIILSLGMSSMAKKNVIIRKMASVETLGSVDIICSDKTGTITQNKMLVRVIYADDKLYSETDNILNNKMLIRCASNCQNVYKNENIYMGDETEVAIYKYIEQINNEVVLDKRLKEYPFDSERKMMSTINEIEGKKYSFTKGSLDSVINNCSFYLANGKITPMSQEEKKKIFDIELKKSKESLRMLAFAYKDKEVDIPEENMIFLGLIGMMDPPRENVPNSIDICYKAGIKPIMITGDSINTGIAIAKAVNIIDDESLAIEGKYVDEMTDDELLEKIEKYQVYARVSPNTKLRIVEALQHLGYVVAMTGDGVNDAPAIQKADIGIGMGVTGTEVVKKVADCILVDDSFATIVDGVEEGRRITSNIKKVILYLLSGNLIEIILVFVSMLLNMEMFTTIQLLWINLVTDSIPAVMLSFEKTDSDVMSNNPIYCSNRSFFTPLLIARMVVSAIFKSIIMLILFLYYVKTQDVATAGSLMFIFLIVNELLFAFSCRNLKKSAINKNIFSNHRLTIGISVLALIQVLVLTTSFSKILIVDNISFKSILFILIICVIIFVIEELTKPIYVKLFKDYTEVKDEKK
ncbi:MAG: cation-translocating P-type ATPase [Mollicutes bacterium]|nr:cation-translocating P-type ATPase [Mollicutes bacterium]